tara:strand:+ start:3107 stop:3562 length:456 start_codon:yes stop_codon:yes gene_type:complete
MSKIQLLNKLSISKELQPWAGHYLDWHEEHVGEIISAEQTLTHPTGYGGTTDLYCTLKQCGSRALVDYKTQGVKEGNKPAFYDSWCDQLVAYRACLPDPVGIQCVSVILNSNKPEPLVHKIWSDKEVERAEIIYKACLTIWQATKKFKPNI